MALWFVGGVHGRGCCCWRSCSEEGDIVIIEHDWCWGSCCCLEWLIQKEKRLLVVVLLLLLVVSCRMKVVLLMLMLPRLMAVLSWKEKKMLPRLCPFLEVMWWSCPFKYIFCFVLQIWKVRKMCWKQ